MELTIQEVAGRLNIPVETLQRWVRQGKIPMQHNRGSYAIRPEMLERWAYEHNLSVRATRPKPTPPRSEADFDGVLAAMQRGGIFYDVQGDSKTTVLRSAVDLLPNLHAQERDLVHDKLMEREQLASTGIGHGIALPHPRSSPALRLERPQITTCFLTRAIPFDAVDHRPVTILMVLLSCSTRQHLNMLSKLAYFLRDTDFRDYLTNVPAKKDLFNTLAAMESDGV